MASTQHLLVLLSGICFLSAFILPLGFSGLSGSRGRNASRYLQASMATAGFSTLYFLPSLIALIDPAINISLGFLGYIGAALLHWNGNKLLSKQKPFSYLQLLLLWLFSCALIYTSSVTGLESKLILSSGAIITLCLLILDLHEYLRRGISNFSRNLVLLSYSLLLIGILLPYSNEVIENQVHASLTLFIAAMLSHGFSYMSLLFKNQNFLISTLASRDPLTNALNRRAFYERAQTIHSIAQRDKKPASVVLIDIDYFRDINEDYGQRVGDKLLQHLQNVISKTFREQDLFARYGGEEFIALLPDTNAQQVRVAMARLQLNIANTPLVADGNSIVYTVSIGACIGFCSEHSLEEMVTFSEEAMQEAKFSGRDQVKIRQQAAGLSLVITDEDVGY